MCEIEQIYLILLRSINGNSRTLDPQREGPGGGVAAAVDAVVSDGGAAARLNGDACLGEREDVVVLDDPSRPPRIPVPSPA